MLVSQFNFHLPRERIAVCPANPRDSAKLLLVGEVFDDLSIKELPTLLQYGDVMVFNDTKVIPAQLSGKSYKKIPKILESRERYGDTVALDSAPSIQITLHKQDTLSIWRAFAKPARKLHIGGVFKISEEFYAYVLAKNEGEVTLEFNVSGDEFYKMLDRYGFPPIPPYIERENKKPIKSDVENYQTIYAKHKGAVAAPTAGLHFTKDLLAKIMEKGVKVEFVTLHVGAGTFLPMKVEDTKDHKMHAEYGVITAEAAATINTAKANGGRVVAVGTTSLRLLESATGEDGLIHPFCGETDIFITPGYKFKLVDILVTNFHLPESTLFMLVCAFAGMEKMQAAYSHAIAQKYRFYSYGDACFLERE